MRSFILFHDRTGAATSGLNFPKADFSVVKHFYSVAVIRPVETPIRGDHRLPFAPNPA